MVQRKKGTDKRTLMVRIMCIILAALMLLSVFSVVFYTL